MILAFPQAEGFGKYATGGRGFPIVKVTNLNNSGAGSFREACAGSNRNIVFEVSGTIILTAPMSVANRSNVTIWGQSAPGEGITIVGNGISFDTNQNYIIRFLRFRGGVQHVLEQKDTFRFYYGQNSIIDHCSFSWGTDKTLIGTFNKDTTFQYNIISESLNASPYSGDGSRGYGCMNSGNNASWYKNLIAHHKARSGKFSHRGLIRSTYDVNTYFGLLDWRNNVIYNWAEYPTHGGGNDIANIVNNYYIPGPARRQPVFNSAQSITEKTFYFCEKNGESDYGRYYVNGNIQEGQADVNANNVLGVSVEVLSGSPTPASLLVPSPYNVGTAYAYNHSAQQAYDRVVVHAGSSFRRDVIDARVIQDVINRSYTYQGSIGGVSGTDVFSDFGIIDLETDAEGFILLSSTPANPTSTANDAISDTFKTANGLNINTDYSEVLAPSGYTWLEEYMNNLVSGTFPDESGTPIPPEQPRKKWAKKRPVV